MRYAVLEDAVVINVIEADSLQTARIVSGKECVEYTRGNNAHIGWVFDGEKFVNPNPEESDTP